MCGIAGIVSSDSRSITPTVLEKMSAAVAHRGPDGDETWISLTGIAGFAHRRLAVIDLTEAGKQPMHFKDRYTIVYNGEIYNYREIRSDLQKSGYHFHTKSDTEVILAAYDFYAEECLKYFDGMFAFAIWDEQKRELFCARDVFGEKPFYYYIDKGVFLFGSEMKALWAAGVERRAEEKMIVNYLTLGYVQHASDKSATFYKDIFSLPPAHFGRYSFRKGTFELNRYRDINKEQIIKINEDEAAERLNALLARSVTLRMRSDVAIGSSLSGGTDSAAVAAMIRERGGAQTLSNFKAFTACFPGFDKDETASAKQTATLNGFQHECVFPAGDAFADEFTALCRQQEEPFQSASIYLQYKVFEAAKAAGIKVLLDGQGADEIFGGYEKYIHWYIHELTGNHKYVRAKKERAAFEANGVPVSWSLKRVAASYLPSHTSLALEKREYNKVTGSHIVHADLLHAIKGKEWSGIYKPVVEKLNDILYHQTMQHGLEELLRFCDRSSMAHGVEVRLPFLQYDLVKFAFSLPSHLKMQKGFTKYILRKAMRGKVPDAILDNARKTGFEPPQKEWMQPGPVQEMIIAAKEKLVHEHLLKPAVLKQKIRPHGAHEADGMDWRYLCLAEFV